MKPHYKTLCEGMKSAHGDCAWTVGKWKTTKGDLSLCKNGFHCSETVLAALGYVRPAFVARVEVAGGSLNDTDKSVHQKMRLVEVWKWKKEDSVGLAIFAAELVIGIYEKRKPGDDRPRKAINAAKKWLADPSEENRRGARTAAAYASAASAYASAYVSAYAYASAASAAYAYASAASAAASDADAAASYADAASAYAYARTEIKAKCEAWIQKRLSEKTSTKA